jgi:hypothetical protein
MMMMLVVVVIINNFSIIMIISVVFINLLQALNLAVVSVIDIFPNSETDRQIIYGVRLFLPHNFFLCCVNLHFALIQYACVFFFIFFIGALECVPCNFLSFLHHRARFPIVSLTYACI